MTGLFERIKDALSIEETVQIGRQKKPGNVCERCTHWTAPDSLNRRIVSSARAIQWAQDQGLGRCSAPGRSTIDGDSKRFTAPQSTCPIWALKPILANN